MKTKMPEGRLWVLERASGVEEGEGVERAPRGAAAVTEAAARILRGEVAAVGAGAGHGGAAAHSGAGEEEGPEQRCDDWQTHFNFKLKLTSRLALPKHQVQ